MSEYLKPQSPLYHKAEDAYFYPLTTSDQVIISSGERLNTLFKKTIRESITLQVANWSTTQPYTQTITLSEYIDDYRVDANVVYGSDDDSVLNKAAGCLTYIEKNNNEIIFYCLKDKPEIDIPIEITGTCRNTIANITVEEGIKLNFEVVGGTTEPTNPKENMIWVNTSNKITGWYFSYKQPENMVEGEVWFVTGTSSDIAFNALKKNDIYVYPLKATQYVSGAWVEKTAKIYQNGEWVELIPELYLYDMGTVSDAAGSLKSMMVKYHSDEVKHNGVLTIGDSTVTFSPAYGSGALAYFKNKIDLTNYKTLYFNGSVVGSGYFGFGVWASLPTGRAETEALALYDHSGAMSDRICTLDISSCTGECYVGIVAQGYGEASSPELRATMKQMYLK